MNDAVIKSYWRSVYVWGNRTIENVPENLRDAVLAMQAAQNPQAE